MLIIKHPELINEWDFVKNEEIDIKLITYGMNIYAYWKCRKNIHESYSKCVSDRTSGTGCRECYLDKKGKHNKKDKEDALERKKKKGKNKSVEIGDDTEKYLVDLLIKTGKYKSVIKLGQIGGNSDIKITHLDDSINFIQVKTLSLSSADRERYSMNIGDKYPDDMLIAGVDKERKYFALTFAKGMKSYLSFSFKCGTSKYKDIMYRDVKIFINKVIEMIPLSCTENLILHEQLKKEAESVERLKQFFSDRGLIYERNETNGNTVDGYINGYKIQTKFVSFPQKDRNCYTVSTTKYGASVNGIQTHICYEEGDFDFFIAEVSGKRGDDNLEKYLGKFCIIPSAIFLKEGIFDTPENKGKTAFGLCPPDYEKNHWTKPYWDNISPLLEPKIIL